MIILPARPAGICPWCTALDISPIYVHGTDRDGNGGCAHYVCTSCSERHGPGGRWHVRVASAGGRPRETAA